MRHFKSPGAVASLRVAVCDYGRLSPQEVVALLIGRVRVQMHAEADEQLRQCAHGHQDDALVKFAPADKVRMETCVIAEVVGDNGPRLRGRITEVLQVGDAHVPFPETVRRIVAALL